MEDIQREDIQIISRYSDLTVNEVDKVLKEHIYSDKEAWQKFLHLFFISLGIGFTVSGIIFFFAYNWADLHKFIKIGLVEGLIIITTILGLYTKINPLIRKIILMGAAVLVGALFAVYGQIYQTGANAYDFFLVWTVFVTLWVIVSNFAPMWLLYLILINATFILYADQVAKEWPDVFIYSLLFYINIIALFIATLFSRTQKSTDAPKWFLYIIALTCATAATLGIIFGIFDTYHHTAFPILISTTALAFAFGIWYGYKTKSGFYLSVIPFSIMIIISALLFKISDGEMMFLGVGLFIIISVTLVIKNLIHLQKRWANEN